MTPTEKRAVYSLASIYSFRMLGLFMILPVFTLYAQGLEGYTPAMAGLAIGIYGLTQALFQIPFGMASDRIGRKPMIIFGLIIFALGSMVAAQADTLFQVVIGRAIQGSGAVAAVVMAMTADLTREEHRLKAMAIIGMSIGMSFSLALVLGPLLDQWVGVAGLFWLTAILAVVGIAIVLFIVPTPVVSRFHRDTELAPGQLRSVLSNKELLRLDFGIFALHLMLTASFVVIPFILRDMNGLPSANHGYVYLPVMLLALVTMVPFVIIAEAKRQMKQVFGAAVLTLALAEIGFMLLGHHLQGVIFSLFLFFAAFNVLEATLPSLIAKTAPPDRKGTAMGVYSSAQFMGAFVGGAAGGWMYGIGGISAVLIFCAVVAGVWFFVAATMHSPRYLSSHMIRVGEVDAKRARQLVMELTLVAGVAEAVVIPDDGIAYLKVDLHALDRESLKKFSVLDQPATPASSQAAEQRHTVGV